jgi:hypothetical protein
MESSFVLRKKFHNSIRINTSWKGRVDFKYFQLFYDSGEQVNVQLKSSASMVKQIPVLEEYLFC